MNNFGFSFCNFVFEKVQEYYLCSSEKKNLKINPHKMFALKKIVYSIENIYYEEFVLRRKKTFT